MTATEEGYRGWLGGLPNFLSVRGTPEASVCQKLRALARETDRAGSWSSMMVPATKAICTVGSENCAEVAVSHPYLSWGR